MLAPGAYEVVEDETRLNVNDNYKPNLSKDCNGQLKAGETKICSIFFDFSLRLLSN